MALLLAAPALAQEGRPTLQVGSSQRSIGAAQGSGCYVSGDTGACVDTIEVHSERVLSVRRGHVLAFDFDRAMKTVEIQGLRPRRRGDGHRWTATVPDSLADGLHELGVATTFDGGDQYFAASVRVARRPPARTTMPKLIGLSSPDAMRALEKRGLRWRLTARGDVEFDSGPPLPPGMSVNPSPEDQIVRRQSVPRGRRISRRAVITLETDCTLIARQGAGCA